MTIVGTRPEIIRLSQVIKACDRYFDHILVHTGQNWDYTLNKVFFEDLKLREPDHYLDSVGDHLGATMGNIIARSFKIPVFHMEAGNRCFDQNVPEEINRKIVDHISDINLPYTEHSRRYLLSEGFRKEHIYVTGSPIREVLKAHQEEIQASSILDDLELDSGNYFLLSAHREENIDQEDNFISLMNGINKVAEKYQMPIIYSTHPRSMKTIEARGFQFHPLVRNIKPLGFFDYNKLQMNAYCVLSDSGTLSEESAMLGFPAVLIRTSTERPEVLDKGTMVIGGIKKEDILGSQAFVPVPDYEDDNVSEKVVRIIQSYAKIVNKVVWGK